MRSPAAITFSARGARKRMIVFFDIDATLIKTQGVGLKALVQAGQELFGPSFTDKGIEVAGRLDPLIIMDMLRQCGLPHEGDAGLHNIQRVRAGYGKALPGHLIPGVGRTLPGVMELLSELERRAADPAMEGRLTLGLLTGNYAETGSIKLRACAIEPNRFSIQVWGDESPNHPPSRNQLPGVGLARFQARRGREADRSRSTVIGDTPHDIACAKAHGLRSIGVATGQFTVDQLKKSGADLAVPDLGDWKVIADWLTR